MSQVQIAHALGVSEAAVSKWKKELQENGWQVLELRKATGRSPRLNQEAKKKLVEKLKQGAIAAGFSTEQWTQARVKKSDRERIWSYLSSELHQSLIG